MVDSLLVEGDLINYLHMLIYRLDQVFFGRLGEIGIIDQGRPDRWNQNIVIEILNLACEDRIRRRSTTKYHPGYK